MIGFVNGLIHWHCDWCWARAPSTRAWTAVDVQRSETAEERPQRPKRWGVGMVVHSADRVETRHACPRHTRQLRAWERNGLEVAR